MIKFIDGYAVRSEDTNCASIKNTVTLKIVVKLFPADYPLTMKISKGEAIYVLCGAFCL